MLAVMAFAPAFGHTAVAGNQFGPDVIAMIPFAPVGRNEFKFFRAVFLCGDRRRNGNRPSRREQY